MVQSWVKETGIIIGDDRVGMARQFMQQPTTLANRRFYKGYVHRVGGLDGGCIVQHSIQDELMESIAGPTMAARDCLENHKGFAKLIGQLDGSLQREIKPSPSIGRHPIQNVLAGRNNRPLIEGSDANRGNGSRFQWHSQGIASNSLL